MDDILRQTAAHVRDPTTSPAPAGYDANTRTAQLPLDMDKPFKRRRTHQQYVCAEEEDPTASGADTTAAPAARRAVYSTKDVNNKLHEELDGGCVGTMLTAVYVPCLRRT